MLPISYGVNHCNMNQKKNIDVVSIKNRIYLRIIILFLIIGLVIFFMRLSFIIVTDKKNGEYLVTDYKFIEDDFSHPRLKLLRSREHLDEVVASGKSQFEKIVLLRHWVNQQWKAGKYFYYPPFDAVEILDLARKHGNYGFCAQYAVVFLQSCQSIGLHARYIDLIGHFATAVWSDEYNRWVVMDPDNDIYYEKDGIPLRGRDLCSAYWNKKTKGIYKVNYDGNKTKVTVNDLVNYKLYSIIMKADQLSEPISILYKGLNSNLTLKNNYREYPYIGNNVLKIFFGESLMWKEFDTNESFRDRIITDDPDDFRYAMNQTRINTIRYYPDKGIVKILLSAISSPTFKTFIINANNSGWQEHKEKQILYLKPGFNKFSARILTKFGWPGTESYIRYFYKPNFFKYFLNKEI